MALLGIPWQFSGYDLALSLPWPGVQSLVGELRFCNPHGTAKKKKKKKMILQLTPEPLFLTAALFGGDGDFQLSHYQLHCQPWMNEAPETK